jgi:hypothetical protein
MGWNQSIVAVLLAFAALTSPEIMSGQHATRCAVMRLRGGETKTLDAKMTLMDARNLCKARGLPSSGKKADLLHRCGLDEQLF